MYAEWESSAKPFRNDFMMCSVRCLWAWIRRRKLNRWYSKWSSVLWCQQTNTRKKKNKKKKDTLTWGGYDTHRPRELEGDQYLAGLVDFVRVILGALKRKHISTENLRRSSPERAGAGGDHLHLVLLQADLEVSVALVSGAAQVRGAPGAVAALPVRQLAVHILHGDQLQLEIAGWLGHLETTF